jgi:hypothetical protein
MYLTGDTEADKLTGNQTDRMADKQVDKARHEHTKRHIKKSKAIPVTGCGGP